MHAYKMFIIVRSGVPKNILVEKMISPVLLGTNRSFKG